MTAERRYFSKRKPEKCPACGAVAVASIQYGYPDMSDPRLKRDLEAGRVVLGGCCISDDDPAWQCTGCGARIWWASR